MKKFIEGKVKGLTGQMGKFYKKIDDFSIEASNVEKFANIIFDEMKNLSFDKVTKDKAGNIIGEIKGYEDKNAVVMVSHIDIISPIQQQLAGIDEKRAKHFLSGIISSIYAGALMKRAMLPLKGDLIICCVPRFEACNFGIKYLFDEYLKDRLTKIKGVILCEPTNFNINLGHNGRMEYEIVVKGKLNRNFMENRGMNMLGTMFPLISELEKVSRDLPNDINMGRSNLRIKDVKYSGYKPQEDVNEFRIVVDRAFIPEESEGFILNKAKTIAKSVYNKESDVMVNTLLLKEKSRTYTGLNVVAEKQYKPWTMDSHHPFALDSLKTLTENGFKSDFGYWKEIVTEGSYTNAILKIPTIGFGAGIENSEESNMSKLGLDDIGKSVLGQGLIIQRSIGMPTFGWSVDEI
ncbi:MAG: hypothetical protein HQL29_00680 [Candidatus Omnitrophica bacterium]|nr:hypothetical protein [Candidatus Omnitrophota bacterium]